MPPWQLWLFAHEKELSLAKDLASYVAGEAHRTYLTTAIEAVWLVFGASKLYHEWNQPDRNTAACLFTLGGLVKDAASLPGGIYSSLKVPDPWANGLDIIVKSGESLSRGKLPPTNEMFLSAYEGLSIPVKILKCAGISLDPSPEFASLTAIPVAPAPAPNWHQRSP